MESASHGGSLGILQAAALGVLAANPQQHLAPRRNRCPSPSPPPRRSPESASPGCPRFCDLTFLEGGQCWCKSKSETQSSACKVGSGSWGQSELGEHWPLGHPSASDPEFIHASSLAVSLSSLSLSNSVISHRLPFPPDLPSWASGCPHGPALTPRRPCPP